jgi:FAD/FMN-containing dehydrogenase
MGIAMNLKEALQRNFGEAVSFDPQILRSYGHDVGEMPQALLWWIRHYPDAVVVIKNAGDVSKLLCIAREYGVSVTPRGQGTSGYGGSLPCRGGIIADLSSFNSILCMDTVNGRVDVEPGIVWEELARRIRPHGLDNRVYPTSAPSSTVGGWFAAGGVGIGSFCYGSARDGVIEIDVANLDGAIRTFSGEEIDPYYQTNGSLGIVTRLRLACRKAEEMSTPAVSFPDANSVIRFLDASTNIFPVYSACVQSAGYIAMRAEAEDRAPPIIKGFLLSLAIPVAQAEADKIVKTSKDFGGSLLSEDIGRFEWDERFYPMRIKKCGPSLLVGEYIIPFAGFSRALEHLDRALAKERFGVEAFAIKGRFMAVLIYLLDNASDFLYPLRMSKAMLPLHLAVRHGGRPYATGMWFAAAAKSVYGERKFKTVKDLKKKVDPSDILNTGKLDGLGLPFATLSGCILAAGRIMAPLSARLAYKKCRRPHNGSES